jgi:hypothetical protein
VETQNQLLERRTGAVVCPIVKWLQEFDQGLRTRVPRRLHSKFQAKMDRDIGYGFAARWPRRFGIGWKAPSRLGKGDPSARQSETVDTSTGHIGFRCIVRDR